MSGLPVRTALRALPLGAIRPRGWLRDQLRLQAEGFTGLLPRRWPDVGESSGWLGGNGEDWERGPYYCDGLIPLAHLLEDGALLERAQRWVDWSLASQRPDGFFGPATNPDWWPRMVMLKVLTQHAEATGDARVAPFLERYFAHQLRELPSRRLETWGQARGAENVLSALWLYERNADPALLELCRLIQSQTLDWTRQLTEFPCTERQTRFDHVIHVVNVAMAMKEPALRFLATGEERFREAVQAGFANLDRYHGQAQGMFSGDEWLAGRDPSQGVELCAVVELMFSLAHLYRIFGDGGFADRLEKVAYNALPATITAEMRARQYDQQSNQVLCSVAKRNWTQNKDDSNIFGLEPNFGCCTANLHQGWPKLASHLWMATDGPEGPGLAAVAYGPCSVTTEGLSIEVETSYPFEERVLIRITAAAAGERTLRLRVPGWCQGASARVNRQPVTPPVLRRRWRVGDLVELELPMAVRLDERPRGAVAVNRGPLVLALRIGEDWRKIGREEPFADWEVHPTTHWNYAIDPATVQAETRRLTSVPFDGNAPPLAARAAGRRVPGWTLVDNSAGPVPASPVRVETPVEEVELIPYGCARLRITELPVTGGAGGAGAGGGGAGGDAVSRHPEAAGRRIFSVRTDGNVHRFAQNEREARVDKGALGVTRRRSMRRKRGRREMGRQGRTGPNSTSRRWPDRSSP
ncbi:MAG TPA: beta-L-arabinofuranosidase domain-containing protein [Chloroflexota bacterium]|nr:beta-L-arabinofuranosidase domain-containing protein [Chloroflexota bacterium]